MLKRLQTRIPGSIDRIRVDHFLMEWLPVALGVALTMTRIRRLVLSGAVYVNRRKCRNIAYPLYSGAHVEVYYDSEKMNQNLPQRLEEVWLETDRIVYEDDWILVVDKPAGIPTQPTIDPLRANLFEMVKRLLTKRDRVDAPYVGLHHRLDRDTSGLVLFTKKPEANKPVAELFQDHKIQKDYHALVWKSPSAPLYVANDRFAIENYVGKIKKNTAKISKFGSVQSGGDFARTEFRIIESFRDVIWLEASPKTGRTHQIRVHSSEHGLPILGDPLYFPSDRLAVSLAPRLMLHAHRLGFLHPLSREPMSISTQFPEDFSNFLGQLKRE